MPSAGQKKRLKLPQHRCTVGDPKDSCSLRAAHYSPSCHHIRRANQVRVFGHVISQKSKTHPHAPCSHAQAAPRTPPPRRRSPYLASLLCVTPLPIMSGRACLSVSVSQEFSFSGSRNLHNRADSHDNSSPPLRRMEEDNELENFHFSAGVHIDSEYSGSTGDPRHLATGTIVIDAVMAGNLNL
eukprot:2814685-Pleurochrysis_carterae.AAC.1